MLPSLTKTLLGRIAHPRSRNTLRAMGKWGGLILSILLVAVWAASRWWDAAYGFWIGTAVDGGRLILAWESSLAPNSFRGKHYLTRHHPRLMWSFHGEWNASGWFVAVPFWTFTIPTIAVTVFAWRRDAAARRRALHNHCPACGYDRAGLLTPNTVCPECGAAAPTAVSATERTARPTR